MKRKVNLTLIITLIFITVSMITAVNFDKANSVTITSTIATTDEQETVLDEMRGLWVSYISLDMTNTGCDQKDFENKIEEIINTALKYKCNSLFIHVRPFCDAIYKSDIYPSSHILTGKQGDNIKTDYFGLICKKAKINNLKVHAWINPYRVATKNSPKELSESNPYIKDNSIGIEYNGNIYLNPSNQKTRDLITDGVKEIIENYPVDGIHFDDYFYPTESADFDNKDYDIYLKSIKSQSDALPLSEWRKNNINLLISQVYRAVKSINKKLIFGISPQGNIKNDLSMGADVTAWAEYQGYVDYICPQLYYSTENPALTFEAGLNDWLKLNRHKNLKLYAGLAVYKAGTDSDNGTWKNSTDILASELNLIRKKNLNGYILYDYEAVISEKAKNEMTNFLELL